jgi:hypothetical protein
LYTRSILIAVITYLLIWLYYQDLVKACLRRSHNCTLSQTLSPATGLKGRVIAVQTIRPLGIRSSFVSSTFWHGLSQVFGTSYHVPSVAQSFVLHDADDIWAVELPIEFEIVPAPVHRLLCLGDLSYGEPSSHRRAIGSLSFCSAPTFHCIHQDRADQGLVVR